MQVGSDAFPYAVCLAHSDIPAKKNNQDDSKCKDNDDLEQPPQQRLLLCIPMSKFHRDNGTFRFELIALRQFTYPLPDRKDLSKEIVAIRQC